MSNLFVWNIYEKSFTPYWASLAPKHQVHRHSIERKPSRVSQQFQDPRSKSIIRFIRKTVLKKSYWYWTSVMLFAILWDTSFRNSFIWAYKKKNYTKSLAYAQEQERVYIEERKRTHPEEFEEDEEEAVEEVGEADDE